jgi:hypothetical protein
MDREAFLDLGGLDEDFRADPALAALDVCLKAALRGVATIWLDSSGAGTASPKADPSWAAFRARWGLAIGAGPS